MHNIEKMSAFYLGKEFDAANNDRKDDVLLYDAKDLTTHAVVVGMTGSGKTGLCLSLLEEAAIDGVPTIAIDPKGDIGNLLLAFPELQPQDFKPWVDAGAATRKGLSTDQFATQTANMWRDGLAEWGQDGERVRKFRDSVDINIYTPGSTSGIPLKVLQSFSAPPAALVEDSDAFRDRVLSTVSGLLALLGIDADPIRSREHILLSNIIDQAWRGGRSLTMESLIRNIQTPPFNKVGFMDLDSFYPAKDRFDLAMSLNNLLAAPGFASWMEGEPLDVQRMLYTPEGKPKISIVSIAHLSESERMFFVTILLNEVVSWMRGQSGTSSLRALLYMDEVFGFFPPSQNPPSKKPMLTLMKQARAFGLGVVLATQNPVDLDYKGLSNAGTWFLGRLQTERDKERVLDGLEGASTSAGAAFDRKTISETLGRMGNRVFLMNNVHDDAPVVFQTRWALSYLRGPLTRTHIQELMENKKAALSAQQTPVSDQMTPLPAAAPARPSAAAEPENKRPVIPPSIDEFFLPASRPLPASSQMVYRPAIFGTAQLHFANTRSNVDEWRNEGLLYIAHDVVPPDFWDEADRLEDATPDLTSTPDTAARFADLPTELTKSKNYTSWKKRLKDSLYRTEAIELFRCAELKETSKPGQTEGDFRAALTHLLHERRDLLLEKLRKKYAPKMDRLQERIRKAEQRVEVEKSQANQQSMSAALSVGASILGALFGRKLASSTNVRRASTSMRSASRAAQQRGDIGRAKETMEALKDDLEELNATFEEEMETVRDTHDQATPDNIDLETVTIRPRKTELSVKQVSLVWTPWKIDSSGIAEPLY